MTSSPPTICPACGARTTGRFCNACGASVEGQRCGACGATMPAGARFCPACGAEGGRPSQGSTARTPWLITGVGALVALVVLIISLARQNPAPAVAEAAPDPAAGGGAPPDISNMSPRERFDRLYNRIMRAAQSGDEATVGQFTPMALLAYTQLDSVDTDARYHAALLRVHTGDVDAALALADTILKHQPNHLFGYLIRGTVARWRKDSAGLARANQAFLAHYDAEMKAGRPEYQEHQPALDEFRKSAQGGATKS